MKIAENARRGFTQTIVNKNKSHSRCCRAQDSEMTPSLIPPPPALRASSPSRGEENTAGVYAY